MPDCLSEEAKLCKVENSKKNLKRIPRIEKKVLADWISAKKRLGNLNNFQNFQ